MYHAHDSPDKDVLVGWIDVKWNEMAIVIVVMAIAMINGL